MNTIKQLSIDTQTLAQLLSGLPVGGVITYDDLSAAIGRDVTTVARHVLDSARAVVLREKRMVLDPVRGQGIKRLSDVEIVGCGAHAVRKIRRAARRGIKIITSVEDFSALPNESKIKHNAYASLLGAVAHATQLGSVKRVEAAVRTVNTQLPVGKTLEAFRG